MKFVFYCSSIYYSTKHKVKMNQISLVFSVSLRQSFYYLLVSRCLGRLKFWWFYILLWGFRKWKTYEKNCSVVFNCRERAKKHFFTSIIRWFSTLLTLCQLINNITTTLPIFIGKCYHKQVEETRRDATQR